MAKKPTTSTTAYLRLNSQNFYHQTMAGEVSAGDFIWSFIWKFDKGVLSVQPSLGRALIEDALLRFLLTADYSLEPGGEYMFIVRAKF